MLESSERGDEPRPGGRPRDRSIDEAVIAATSAILDADGYAGVSVERVAKRAGTSRPAIYRRWSGRAPLVLAAIAERLDVPEPPDTGCILCDLGEGFNCFLLMYRTIRPDALAALYTECLADEELRQRYVEAIVAPARRAVSQVLDRAIERGDLRADTDRELLLDLLGSLVQYRAMFGHEHLSDAEAEGVLELLLRGAAVDYDELLAHSKALSAGHVEAPHHADPNAG